MNPRFLVLYSAFALVFSLGAETTGKGPQPTAPYLGKMPAVSSWKIVSTSMKKPKEPAPGASNTAVVPSSRETIISKSGSRRLEVTTSSKGARSEKFYVKGLLFEQKSGYASGDVFVDQAAGGSEADFPELAWVSLENFVEVRKENGKSYFVYLQSPKVLKENHLGARTVTEPCTDSKGVEAWIEMETKLPFRVCDGINEKIYDFKANAGKVEPSPDIKKRVESYFNGSIPQ